MSIPSRLAGLFLTVAILAPGLHAQSNNESAAPDPRAHLQVAQRRQQSGDLEGAAGEYRAFLADTLGELAMGFGLARDYAQSAPLFDEALSLEPDSPTLMVDYAETAVTLGDLDHAKTLAGTILKKYRQDPDTLSAAHQVLGRADLKMNRDQEARKHFEAAVALDPTFPNGYDLAIACLDLDDQKCAAQLFVEMERSFGDTATLHLAFGRAYGDSDYQPQAIPEFRQAIAENPRLPGAHYDLAAVLLATGDSDAQLQAAETELKRELAISPRDYLSYAALGKIAAAQHRYPDAETYLRKAVSIDSASPDAYLYLGQVYFDTDRQAQAESTLRQCIQLTTDVARNRYQVQKAHFLLGRLLMQQHQPDAAHAEMQIARELANKGLSQDKSKLAALLDTPAAADAADASAEQSSAEAIAGQPDREALRRVSDLRRQVQSAVAETYNNLGVIAATNAGYSQAVGYFERAAEWNPSLDGLDYNWGRAAFAASQFADALAPLSRYLAAHPQDQGARNTLAVSQFMTGNYKGCLSTLRAVPEEAERLPQMAYVYAQSLVMTGQVAAGIEHLLSLRKSHPEIPDVHRALGEALALQGNGKQAADEFREAIHLNPNDAQAHCDLGTTELSSGDTVSAIADLEAAVRLLPDKEAFHRQLAAAYKAASQPADEQKELDTASRLREAHAKIQAPLPPPSPAMHEQ